MTPCSDCGQHHYGLECDGSYGDEYAIGLDPETEYRRRWPHKAKRTAQLVKICMQLHDRGCVGSGCDEGRHCERHARIPQVAERYLRLRERRTA